MDADRRWKRFIHPRYKPHLHFASCTSGLHITILHFTTVEYVLSFAIALKPSRYSKVMNFMNINKHPHFYTRLSASAQWFWFICQVRYKLAKLVVHPRKRRISLIFSVGSDSSDCRNLIWIRVNARPIDNLALERYSIFGNISFYSRSTQLFKSFREPLWGVYRVPLGFYQKRGHHRSYSQLQSHQWESLRFFLYKCSGADVIPNGNLL